MGVPTLGNETVCVPRNLTDNYQQVLQLFTNNLLPSMTLKNEMKLGTCVTVLYKLFLFKLLCLNLGKYLPYNDDLIISLRKVNPNSDTIPKPT